MSARNNESHEQLSAYLDGELSEADAAAVARALQADPQLAGELERLRAVRQLVASLPRESAPAGLASRVLAQARPAGRAPGPGGLARLAVAVGLGITMLCYLSKAPRADQGHVALTDAPERPAVAAAGALAAADVEDMPVVQLNAGNRVVAEQELEEMFVRNDIRLVAKARVKVAPAGPETANFYDRTQTGLNQTRYTVVMDTKRLRQIFSELNSLRASHDIAVIPMSRQLESAGARTELAMRRRHLKGYAPARPAPGKPVPAHLPPSRAPKMMADRLEPKAVFGVAAASRPAKRLASAPAAPTAEPLDYRQFMQDGRRRRDGLAMVDLNELVIIVNGDDGPAVGGE